MPDYIPRRDNDFMAWAANFSTYLAGHAGEMGIGAEEVLEITSGVGQLETSIERHWAQQAASQSVRQLKDSARSDVQEKIRTLVRQLQASTLISDSQRASLGITIEGKGKAAANCHKPTCPKLVINMGLPLRHIIRYFDEKNLSRRAKPRQTLGCEIWCAITDSHPDTACGEEAFRNLGLSTRSGFISYFSSADAGKIAHYRARWISTDGAKGAWSALSRATIAG